jgi:hypothetical protein
MRLPDDIVIAIATQLKRRNASNRDLISFILVCKQWHQLGRRVLHGNIALASTTLIPFARSFNASAYAGEVRSLTLRVEGDNGMKPGWDDVIRKTGIDWVTHGGSWAPSQRHLLPDRIASIVPLVFHLHSLASFSL